MFEDRDFKTYEKSTRWAVGVLFVVLLGVVLAVATTGTATAQGQSAPNCSNVNYNGDGTSINPHEVSNLDQLQCIEDQGLGQNYRLVSDIDASDTASWNGGDGFEPIGGSSFSGTSFNSTFDGDGHEITDLTINRQNEDEVGLFASVDTTGTLTDVSVVDADVTGSRFVGGLAGISSGTVSNSSASGNVTGDDDVGGLIGQSDGEDGGGTVTDSSASGNVTGDDDVGGLVGFSDETTVSNSSASGNVEGNKTVGGLVGSNNGMVTESSASGNVEGNKTVGGLVGDNDESTVSNSSASGNVTGDNDDVGGLVGISSGTVSNSSASGNVEGNESVGGLVGFNIETVENSYARGNITGNSSVGGLVGKNGGGFGGTVSQSYATGDVTGLIFIPDPLPDPFPDPIPDPDPTLTQDNSLTVGGLVGNNSGTVSDSYWDVNTTGFTTSDGGTGLNTSEMTGDAATGNMSGFDFTDTWETVTGDYPILAWQSVDDGGNPFFDSSGNPLPRREVINRVVEWNTKGSIDGTPYTRREIINFVVQWNMAQ